MSTFTSSAPGSRHSTTPPWEKADAGFLGILPGAGAWTANVGDGKLHALRSRDDGLWHLSVSHTTRLPSWDELADARYRFIPDRAHMASLLPPRAEWVDVHPRTLHLWELTHHPIEPPTSPSTELYRAIGQVDAIHTNGNQ